MSAALDLRSHYRAVRQRINARALRVLPPPAPPPSLAVPAIIYAEPIGPRRPLFAQVSVAAATPARARKIVAEVAEKHGLTVDQLISYARSKHLVLARQELYWRLHAETTWSIKRIGDFLERDHTTVLHGIRRQRKLLLEAGE